MNLTTAYLCDHYAGKDSFQIAEPLLHSYGGVRHFSGLVNTLKCFEANTLIAPIVSEPGQGRVLVIDGGGSHRCALVDNQLAALACQNGWQGIVIYGAVRDVALLEKLPIGILALQPHPLLCHKSEGGDRDVLVSFVGVNFKKDYFLCADSDGMVVSETMLS